MANNPITTPLPADLPTDWTYGQTIAANGSEVGLSQQHGYNYLMQQVNAAQQAATQIGQAFSGIPSLGSDGKIPASQLPAMNYDPAGSAAAVQTNLTNHINNKNNPHGVTPAQIGAKADFSVLPVSQGGTGVTSIPGMANALFPSQIGDMGTTYNFALLGPGWGGNGYMSLASLVPQIAANGGCRIATGSYVGTGADELTIQLPWVGKWLTLIDSVDSSGNHYGAPFPGNTGACGQSQVYLPGLPSSIPSYSSSGFSYQGKQWLSGTTFYVSGNYVDIFINQSGYTYYWMMLG